MRSHPIPSSSPSDDALGDVQQRLPVGQHRSVRPGHPVDTGAPCDHNDATDGKPTATSPKLAALESYRPKATAMKKWDKVRAFVLYAVELTSGADETGARRLLTITAPFVLWCVGERGLPLQVETVFTPGMVDAYCSRVSLKAGTGATYRSSLMRISAALLPEANPPAMTPMRRRTIQPPYSAAEMKKHRAWAKGQHTLNNRHKAMVMLALSAGAGLWPAEIGLVLREDVVTDEAGTIIVVRGDSPRCVPLLRQWEEWVHEVAETRALGEPMFGSTTRGNDKSMLTDFTTKSLGTAPTNSRLRATWIVTHLALATPMKALFRAAGFKQFGNLHHYLPYVADINEVKYRELLRTKASS